MLKIECHQFRHRLARSIIRRGRQMETAGERMEFAGSRSGAGAALTRVLFRPPNFARMPDNIQKL
jgi:hypothetical protein